MAVTRVSSAAMTLGGGQHVERPQRHVAQDYRAGSPPHIMIRAWRETPGPRRGRRVRASVAFRFPACHLHARPVSMLARCRLSARRARIVSWPGGSWAGSSRSLAMAAAFSAAQTPAGKRCPRRRPPKCRPCRPAPRPRSTSRSCCRSRRPTTRAPPRPCARASSPPRTPRPDGTSYVVIPHGEDGVLEAFEAAQRAGAAVIVGPLVRDDVKIVAQMTIELPWTIALNQLDEARRRRRSCTRSRCPSKATPARSRAACATTPRSHVADRRRPRRRS